MHLGKRKTIALMISRAAAEYQSILIKNVSMKAAEYGYYTLVYTSFGGYGTNKSFEVGEEYVVEMPNYESLDGIILALDTFSEQHLADRIVELVKKRASCPVVCIRRPVEDYHSVLVDDENSMRSVVSHLIEAHSYKDFCYVSGPKEHPDAIKRLCCFQRVLKEHSLECSGDNIFYGDFWRNCGQRAVEYLLEGRKHYPDVIVCANDYMAISVINALHDRGIRVPQDIAVTGFDDISEAEANAPSLTSVRVDTAALATQAVEMLHRLQSGHIIPRYEYIPTQVVMRESCGCPGMGEASVEYGVRSYFEQTQQFQAYNLQTIFMAIDSETARDVDDLGNIIYTYVFNNLEFRDFYVVLNDYDWGTQDSPDFLGFTEKVHLRTAIRENILLGHIDHVFRFEDILPEEYVYEEPCAYFFVPLHYQEACFGYCMINYKDWHGNGPFFQFLVTTICNTLESIRIRRKMSLLIDKLQDMYVSDVMTGLYNRHGFEQDSKEMYSKAVSEGRSMGILGIDMDGLKTINDTFGHAHGDIALKAIANAISAACLAEERCYRVGGDEFEVLALDYTEEMAQSFHERLDGFLADYNARSGRPYYVQASFGYAIAEPAEERPLGEWVTISDNQMYRHKAAGRETRKIIREEKK